MANIPISQLPSSNQGTSTTLIPIVVSGDTYKIQRDVLVPRAYGQYLLVNDQSLSANTPTVVNLDVTTSQYNLSLSSNTITFTSGGTFLVSASYQFSHASGSGDIAFWFNKNGSPITNSATHQSVSSNTKYTAMVTMIETFSAGNTLNLLIQSTSGNSTIDNIPVSGSIPDAPGVILTISQIY
jgi:hypothetical protein